MAIHAPQHISHAPLPCKDVNFDQTRRRRLEPGRDVPSTALRKLGVAELVQSYSPTSNTFLAFDEREKSEFSSDGLGGYWWLLT